MIINLISIGSKPNAWESDSMKFYTKQLPKNFNINFTYIKNLSSSKLSTREIIKKESTMLLEKVPKDSYLISWDSSGKQVSSTDFANLIRHRIQTNKSVCFLIGGSHGFSEEI